MTDDRPMNVTLRKKRIEETPRVRTMVVIHRIFRREFPLLADLVRQTPAGDVERARPIADHLDLILMGLHHHHSAEDDVLWPTLLERARPHAELIERMEAQHAAVAEHVTTATKLLAEWREDAAAATSTELAVTLARLDVALSEHLDEEESELLPLVSRHITAEEWTRFGQQAFDQFPRSALPVLLGQVLEDASPEERQWFLGDLPWFVRLGWRVSGQRGYRRYIARVRGE